MIALVLLVALALAGRGVGSRLVGFDFVASADAGSGGFASALEVVAETAGVAAEEIFVGKSPEDLALSRRLAGAGESSDIFGNSRGMLRLIRSVFRSGIESSDRWGAGFSSGLLGAGEIGADALAAGGGSVGRLVTSGVGGTGVGFGVSVFGASVAGAAGFFLSAGPLGGRVKRLPNMVEPLAGTPGWRPRHPRQRPPVRGVCRHKQFGRCSGVNAARPAARLAPHG